MAIQRSRDGSQVIPKRGFQWIGFRQLNLCIAKRFSSSHHAPWRTQREEIQGMKNRSSLVFPWVKDPALSLLWLGLLLWHTLDPWPGNFYKPQVQPKKKKKKIISQAFLETTKPILGWGLAFTGIISFMTSSKASCVRVMSRHCAR